MCVNYFLSKTIPKREEKEKKLDEVEHESRYITLPYLGEYSKVAKSKIKDMVKKYCKPGVNVSVVFTACKLRSYFSTKDSVPSCFKSNVVYSFVCARCQSCYVGRTHSYFNNRRKQQDEKDRNSSIFSHLKNSEECKALCSNDAFRILDEAKTDYELALKESMHIKWRNPSLNIQKKHVILKLLV